GPDQFLQVIHVIIATGEAVILQHPLAVMIGKRLPPLVEHRFITVENWSGLEGMGNFDVVRRQMPDGKVYEGRTVRTFDPKTRLWRLYWMDSNGGPIDPPVIGSFENGVGLFFCKDYQVGRPVIIVFRWDKTNPNQPVWGQAFSDDNGKTWEWNSSNTSYRVK
ncbi:MAG TPA: hypothetical protein VGQ51_05345, partial [Puia sp.]|nr:hypothetical protein [Puia sp.]